MQSELEGNMKTGIFSIVDRVPEGRKFVDSSSVSNITDKESNMTKFKASLVARRFTQIRNVDHTHSSSPVRHQYPLS